MLSDTSGNGPQTVIVDVRNAYESAIGHFSPPEGGAKLIDPQMRNSHDFPGWLAKPEVQSQLNGKRVSLNPFESHGRVARVLFSWEEDREEAVG